MSFNVIRKYLSFCTALISKDDNVFFFFSFYYIISFLILQISSVWSYRKQKEAKPCPNSTATQLFGIFFHTTFFCER